MFLSSYVNPIARKSKVIFAVFLKENAISEK